MNELAASGVSGVAMKLKLFSLETRCAMFERKLHSANIYMFRTLSTAWAKKQIHIDPLEVVISYKRTMPVDYLYESQVLSSLKGNVSDHTSLGMCSFVDSVDYELELMEKEKSGIPEINLDFEEEQTESDEIIEDERSNHMNLYSTPNTEGEDDER